jgi:hypothetical protein
LIHYYLAHETADEVRLTIHDPDGNVVREYTATGWTAPDFSSSDIDLHAVMRVGRARTDNGAGMHRFVWDLKYPPAYLAPGVNEGFRERIAVVTGYTGGPYAVPGTYSVTMSVGDWSRTEQFEVEKDPRLATTIAELEETFDMSIRLRDRITEIQLGIARGQRLLAELDEIIASGGEPARTASQEKIELEAVLSELYKHGEQGDHAHLYPELTTDYARVYSMISDSDHRPPASAYPRLVELDQEFDELMTRLRRILDRRPTT